jgi:hypothetical protein
MSGHCYLDRATKEESTDGTRTRTRDARDVSPHETGRGDDGKTMVRSDPVLARPTGRNETRVSRHPLPLYRLGTFVHSPHRALSDATSAISLLV